MGFMPRSFTRNDVVEALAGTFATVMVLVVIPYYLIFGCRRRPRASSCSALRVERLDKSVRLPERSGKDSSGYHVYAPRHLRLEGDTCTTIDTGLRLHVPSNHVALVYPLSIISEANARVIGHEDREELLLEVPTTESVHVRPNVPIAYMILVPSSTPKVVEARVGYETGDRSFPLVIAMRLASTGRSYASRFVEGGVVRLRALMVTFCAANWVRGHGPDKPISDSDLDEHRSSDLNEVEGNPQASPQKVVDGENDQSSGKDLEDLEQDLE